MKIEAHADYPEMLKSGDNVLQAQKELYEQASASNIENFVGTVRIPVGLAGPVEVHGEHARGTFFIPMATTEGTLVASTSRGMKVINESFCSAMNEDWSWLKSAVESSTSHGKLTDISAWQLGHAVCVRVTMDPGDASGQNMVSVAAQNGTKEILDRFPKIRRHRMGGGLSGEKVSSNINTLLGRGRSVVASVSIPGAVMKQVTRANIDAIPRLQQQYSNFAMWGGHPAANNSIANTLTAMYIAAGQDAATTCESRIASNVLDYDSGNDVLHWDVHVPTLTVGTVGGGTGLPTQRECLETMDCHGSGKVNKFAELCAVAALANEISFWGAMCAHEWIDAHADLKSR